MKSDHPTQRPCRCGGTNPNCPRCGGKGVISASGFRGIMSGPTAIRRRAFVPRGAAVTAGAVAGPPAPVRCPHCNFEVLNLAVHLAEDHPDQPQGETEAERQAREKEEARQAAVAAEIARREAEAAQRKAEARARRQELEGLEAAEPTAARPRATPAPPTPPRRSEPMQGSPSQTAAPVAPVVPAAPVEPTRQPSADAPMPPESRAPSRSAIRHAEGPMALAFRLAREKKEREE